MTIQNIPFLFAEVPAARDEMAGAEFDKMMQRGLDDAKENRARLAAEDTGDALI